MEHFLSNNTKVTSLIFITIFILIRRRFPFFYAPRTFMGSIPEKCV